VSRSPGNLTNVGGTLFFTAFQDGIGIELWKSDGTEAGTVLVKDINPGPGSSFPGGLTAVNSTLFFGAFRPDTGYELWKSDGTAAGTVLVKDVYPGPGSSYLGGLTAVNGTLFFRAFDPSTGSELWKSDGTEAGTVLVKDVYPGPGSSYPDGLTAVNGTLFFGAFDPSTGYELWKSDGTEAGTVLVKDIAAGAYSSGATPLVGVNGVLLFGTSYPYPLGGLWRTDGTEAGTTLIQDGISTTNLGIRCASGAATVNDIVVFVVRRGFRCELWRSDGVTADFLTTSILPTSSALRMVSGLVLFTGYDAPHGAEPWATDGTSVGMIQDIAPGAAWSFPQFFTPVGNLVYFQADDHVVGPELWAMSRSAIHRALNLPEPSPDVAASEGPAPRQREAADESRAFLPAFEGVPDELVASEGDTP